jgi:hypothetical protein
MKDEKMTISGDLFAALSRDPFYGKGAEKMVQSGKWKISDEPRGAGWMTKK